jgi:hypothetical protein
MRRLIVITAVAAGLVFATAAVAVLPSQRAVYKGTTSEKKVNGYKATVRFVAPAGGRVLTNFAFQTLGCFGTGMFPVGVDPFAANSWRLPKIPVEKTGAWSAKLKASSTALDPGTLTATVTGSFTNASTVEGKITYSQAHSGATCGPRTVKFVASSS